MNTPHCCPKCGAILPADAPEGLCPACLLSGAFPSEAGTVKMTPSQKPSAHEPAPTPTPEELAPLFPQLEILELLGRGGMGAVYKARQPKLNRFVALKILPVDESGDPQFTERFQREAQALAKLNHPNIVSVFDFGESGGLFYFLMEFVDGANLRTLIRSGEMKPEAALALIPAFCDALQYAHDEGVVHRDIKPENVLVDKKGRVKIADFGLAKLLGHDASDHTLTRTGMHLGTPRYMAPEQFDRPETVDHRADIYSLGVVFYEMLTGELPMGRFAPPSQKVQVDVKLDEIVLRSLERDVERRYQHASEIKTDMENVSLALDRMPLHLKRMMGWEHRSKRTIFGLPLLHIAFGLDPATGRRRTAKGIIAVGDRACGVVAFGGLAYGGIVFGGLGVGVVAFSGLSLGLISMGGLALGLLFAYGGVAAAPFALGGLAAGWVAAGGAAYGGHVMSSSVSDPLAKEFFQTWGLPVNLLFYAMMFFGLGVPLLAHFLGRQWEGRVKAAATGVQATRGAGSGRTVPAQTPVQQESAPRPLLSAFLVLLCLAGFFIGLSFQATHSRSAAGMTETITVGALDPLYFSERGPSGFQTSLNFFSWSFFAVVVCGIAFSALWRIGREDQGKVPRDPAWWRGWWKQVGIWGGLLLIACMVRTVMHPEKVLQLTGDRAATTKNPAQKLFSGSTPRIVAEEMGTLEPEQYRFRYQIHTPPDHRVIVWMETTRNGKPVVIPGLANNISSSTQPSIGERFDGDAEFSLVEGSRITPDSKGKWRWDFKHGTVGKNTHRISPGGWIDNPFVGMSTSVHQGPKLWEPKPGEEVSILVIRSGSHSYSRDPTEEPPAGEIELRLKARIDPVPLFHRVQGSVGSSLRDPFPTPATPLGRIAAGFKLDPKLPEDEIRRQMIAELTSNDSKRLNAEMILKSVGKPVTRETKPEDVLKALEDVAQRVE